MGGNGIRLDQRHVVDEQAQDALALARIDARVIPDLRQLLGEIEDAAAHVCIECDCLLLAASLVVCGGVSMKTQLVVPFCFEGIGDEPVVGIDLHVTSPREFGTRIAAARHAGGARHRSRQRGLRVRAEPPD